MYCRNCGNNFLSRKFLGFAALILLIILVVTGMIWANRCEKIEVGEIIKSSFYGYDTVGEGSFYIDETKIPAELLNTISISPGYAGFLTNGDEVDVSVTYDNDIAKEFGIRLQEKRMYK